MLFFLSQIRINIFPLFRKPGGHRLGDRADRDANRVPLGQHDVRLRGADAQGQRVREAQAQQEAGGVNCQGEREESRDNIFFPFPQVIEL